LPLKLSDLRMLRKAVAEAGLLREEHARVAADVVAHRSNVHRLMAAKERVEAELRAVEAKRQAAEAWLQKVNASTEARLQQAKDGEASYRKSVELLKAENTDLDKRRQALREAYARDLDGDPIKNLKKELASMQARIDQWRAKNIQLASQVDVLKQANARGSKALNEMTDRYENLKDEVERRGTEKEAKLNRRRHLFDRIMSGGTV